jgi:hypothetical protein
MHFEHEKGGQSVGKREDGRVGVLHSRGVGSQTTALPVAGHRHLQLKIAKAFAASDLPLLCMKSHAERVPVLFVERDGCANLHHTMPELFNAWMVSRLSDVDRCGGVESRRI